jgi:hypothetical protein
MGAARKRISKGLRAFAERVEKHHAPPKPAEEYPTIEVVVSGFPVKVRRNPNEKVHAVMRAAMRGSGATGADYPDIAGWTLRTQEGGQALNPGGLVADLPDETLFLDIDEGGGGNVRLRQGVGAA